MITKKNKVYPHNSILNKKISAIFWARVEYELKCLAMFSISARKEDGADFDRESTRNCQRFFSDLSFTRPMSTQDDGSPQFTIPVFSRNSLIVTGFKAVKDLEDYDFCDLDECIPTVRLYPQDDCLHTEIPPLQSRALLGRARYNFQQGLLNTKEVMEIKDSRLCQAAPIEQDWAPE